MRSIEELLIIIEDAREEVDAYLWQSSEDQEEGFARASKALADAHHWIQEALNG